MTTLSPGHALCKKCNAITPVYFISSFSTGPMHTDFYQENLGTQVVCYTLSICPKCLFVGTAEEFKEIQDDIKTESPWEQLRELEERYPPCRRYIMLAERLEKEGATKTKIGDCYLKASWAERVSGTAGERSLHSIELEKQCQTKTLKYFLEALDLGEMKGTCENFYLLGELFRRTEDFTHATQFFNKAKMTLKEERYFCIFLDDAGPNRKAISQKIREVSTINRKESFSLIDNVPSKILGNLIMEEAMKHASDFNSMGAKVTIKEEDEISLDRKRLLNLISAMEQFAIQKDARSKIIGPEYLE
jgi:ribosomal protein L7/L12